MFYTYLWLREDGTPYYVGKGSGNRAFISSAHGVHKPVTRERIIVQNFESEEDAFEAEKFLIACYGRLDLSTGCLRNLTDGGEDPPSWKGKKRVHPVGTSAKISSKIKELWRMPEYREHMSAAHKGKNSWNQGVPCSEETKEKLRTCQRKNQWRHGTRAGRELHKCHCVECLKWKRSVDDKRRKINEQLLPK